MDTIIIKLYSSNGSLTGYEKALQYEKEVSDRLDSIVCYTDVIWLHAIGSFYVWIHNPLR